MAKVFETWTVLPHDPIRKHGPHLWSVPGTMPNPKIKRVMTVGKRSDGRLVIHNAIALGDAEMKELEAFGEPAFLVVPNAFHRQDAKIWMQRYPKMKVYCPEGTKKGVGKVVAPDGSYGDYPKDDRVLLEHIDGTKRKEGAMIVHDEGVSLVFNDLIGNQPVLKGASGYFFGPTGRPSVPRVSRWLMVSDKRALVAHLERLRGGELRRVIVSHGAMIEGNVSEALRSVGDELVA